MRSRIILLPAFLLAAGLMLPACGDSSRAEPLEKKQLVEVEPLAVSVIPVEQGDLLASLSISGSLSARSRVAVIPKMSGTLRRVLVDIGDHVGEGQVVAVQDTRELDAQLDAAKAAVAVASASLEQAEAALANAHLEFDRAKNLFEKGALAKQRLDAAETALRSSNAQRSLAQATLQQAEASARRAQEVARDATLTAPTGGVVVERNFDVGALGRPRRLEGRGRRGGQPAS
jgi:HlyD family secretion protein